MEGPAAVVIDNARSDSPGIESLDLGSDINVAFRAKEESVCRAPDDFHQKNIVLQL